MKLLMKPLDATNDATHTKHVFSWSFTPGSLGRVLYKNFLKDVLVIFYYPSFQQVFDVCVFYKKILVKADENIS